MTFMISILLFLMFFLQLQVRSSPDPVSHLQLAQTSLEPRDDAAHAQDTNVLSTPPESSQLLPRSTVIAQSPETTSVNLFLLLGTTVVLVLALGTVVWKRRRRQPAISLPVAGHEMLPVASVQPGSQYTSFFTGNRGVAHRVRSLLSKQLGRIVPGPFGAVGRRFGAKITPVRWEQLLTAPSGEEDGVRTDARPSSARSKPYPDSRQSRDVFEASSSYDNVSLVTPQNDLLHEYPPLHPSQPRRHVSPQLIFHQDDAWDRSLDVMELGSSPGLLLAPGSLASPYWASISSLSTSPATPAFAHLSTHLEEDFPYYPDALPLEDLVPSRRTSNKFPASDSPRITSPSLPILELACHASADEVKLRLSTSTPTPQSTVSELNPLALDQHRSPSPADITPIQAHSSHWARPTTTLSPSARIPASEVQRDSEKKLPDMESGLCISDNPQGLLSPPPDAVSFATCKAQSEYGRMVLISSVREPDDETEASAPRLGVDSPDIGLCSSRIEPGLFDGLVFADEGASMTPVESEAVAGELCKAQDVDVASTSRALGDITNVARLDIEDPEEPAVDVTVAFDDPDYLELPNGAGSEAPFIASQFGEVQETPLVLEPEASFTLALENLVLETLSSVTKADVPASAFTPGSLLTPGSDASTRGDFIQVPTPPASPVASRAALSPVSRSRTPIVSRVHSTMAYPSLQLSPACSSSSLNLPKPAWSIRASDAPALGLHSDSKKAGDTLEPPVITVKAIERSPSLPGAFFEDDEEEPAVVAPGKLQPATSDPLTSPNFPSPPIEVNATSVNSNSNSSAIQPRPDYPRSRNQMRSPLDIALAMQLRPALGIGADAAWMVRFLMAMFGWLTLLVGQHGEY